jgi:lipoprotein-releasing system permease protein
MRAFWPLWSWAARDVMRRPLEALLALLALSSLVVLLAAGLLLSSGLSATSQTLLEAGPSLVARRVGPNGWQPMPEAALARARHVTGVTRASLRIFGVVRFQERAVTVVGEPAASKRPLAEKTAICGPAFDAKVGEFIRLDGATHETFKVVEVLSEKRGLAAHDLIVVPKAAARRLLGLPKNSASDLALWVFHQNEMDAIRPDLERALGFAVVITTQKQAIGAAKARIERAAGVRVTVLLPALLALALLTLAMTRIQLGSRRDIGLLKALGWRSADVVRLSVFRALIIGLPAIALGLVAGYALVFFGARWAGHLLFGWTDAAPYLA